MWSELISAHPHLPWFCARMTHAQPSFQTTVHSRPTGLLLISLQIPSGTQTQRVHTDPIIFLSKLVPIRSFLSGVWSSLPTSFQVRTPAVIFSPPSPSSLTPSPALLVLAVVAFVSHTCPLLLVSPLALPTSLTQLFSLVYVSDLFGVSLRVFQRPVLMLAIL